MSCERAEAIDLEAFLIGDDAPGLDAFRAHYPSCADCAATVERWSALELSLRDVVGETLEWIDRHPTPETLEAYATAPGDVSDIDRELVTHLESCGICRAEISLLRRFDPILLGAGEAAPGAPPARTRNETAAERLRAWIGEILDATFAPGFGRPIAVAALLLLALVGGLLLMTTSVDQTRPTPDVARRDEPSPTGPDERATPTPLADPQGPEAIVAPRDEALARAAPPADGALPDPGPESVAPSLDRAPSTPRTESEDRSRLADARGPWDADTNDAPQTPEPSPPPQSEVRLAALIDLPPPAYAAPEAIPGSAAWMRQFGPARSGDGVARVRVRAPRDHVGLTLAPAPRLWWSLSEGIPYDLRVTIVDDESVRPALRVDLPGPQRGGLHALDLGDRGIVIDPGRDYRWYVSIIVDPKRPSRNPVSAGGLRRLETSDARAEAVATASGATRGHALAQSGIWYDAFDFFASIAVEHPEEPALLMYVDALDESAATAP